MSSDKIKDIIVGIFDTNQRNRRYLRTMYEFLPGKACIDWSMTDAARVGHKYIVQLCIREGGQFFSDNSIRHVIRHGWHDLLLRAINAGQYKLTDTPMRLAFEYGQMSIVSALRLVLHYPIQPFHVDGAAARGHLHLVQYAAHHGIYGTTRGANAAAMNGRLDILSIYISDGIYPSRNGADGAAEQGHLDMVLYLDDLGICCTEIGMQGAVENGCVEVAKFLYHQKKLPIRPFDFDQAAQYGHVKILRYFYGLGITPCTPSGYHVAIEQGRLEVVQFLFDLGYTCTQREVNAAAANGHLPVIQFLHTKMNILPNTDGANQAATYGYLDVVQFLHSLGIICTSTGANRAAKQGYLDMVRFLYEHGIYCTAHGWTDIVEWADPDFLDFMLAKEQQQQPGIVPVTDRAANMACQWGKIPVVQWLRNKCGILPTQAGVNLAINAEKEDMIEYLYNEYNLRCSHFTWSRIRDEDEPGSRIHAFLSRFHT